ncbi:hypothetical protein STCU_11960 [Strigomonas culicis]|uniref:Uncharacterized protein n=1 Tax=Strigomonas culicis TaxID=28005 RepID=S9ULF2_9TRYP|nr:hypothetical protein STCU_11960 [Strigomonas culicis]|eukprot:EPY15516.1 hypothetical protein STCU_11960 [Strigomonas culicis]
MQARCTASMLSLCASLFAHVSSISAHSSPFACASVLAGGRAGAGPSALASVGLLDIGFAFQRSLYNKLKREEKEGEKMERETIRTMNHTYTRFFMAEKKNTHKYRGGLPNYINNFKKKKKTSDNKP